MLNTTPVRCEPVIHTLLQRSVAERLLDHTHRARIEGALAARQSPPTRRPALAIEALGYLGGPLAAIAGFTAVSTLWSDITTRAELAFAVFATGVTLLIIALLLAPSQRDAPSPRAR